MNENFEKLEDIMIAKYHEAQLSIEEKRFICAFKCLCKSYKIALKTKNSIYMDLCASNLADVCPKVAKSYIVLSSRHSSNKKYHHCLNCLKKARNVAKLGIYFEQFYHKTENEKILNSIEELIESNKENIKTLRQENFERLKDGCHNFFENIGDFISDIFSPSYETTYIDNDSNDDESNNNEEKILQIILTIKQQLNIIIME